MEATSERECKANCFSSSYSRMDFFPSWWWNKAEKETSESNDEIHRALTRWNLNFPCFKTKLPK